MVLKNKIYLKNRLEGTKSYMITYFNHITLKLSTEGKWVNIFYPHWKTAHIYNDYFLNLD